MPGEPKNPARIAGSGILKRRRPGDLTRRDPAAGSFFRGCRSSDNGRVGIDRPHPHLPVVLSSSFAYHLHMNT